MSNTIYLYLKTHNITGLKYLGKTTLDPFKYSGSGKIWKDHIKKHGYDVSTEILFETTDPKEFEKIALGYSEKWNIVESKKFANLVPESGQGGDCTSYWTKESYEKISNANKGKRRTKNQRKNISISHADISGEKNPMYGKYHTSDTKLKLSNRARNRSKVSCLTCRKELDISNYNRWHGSNCRN